MGVWGRDGGVGGGAVCGGRSRTSQDPCCCCPPGPRPEDGGTGAGRFVDR